MSSATTGETEMFSGPEIHISARRRGSFYLKSRAEQAVKAELETLLHGSAADSTQTGRGLLHPSELPMQVNSAGTAHDGGVMSHLTIQYGNNLQLDLKGDCQTISRRKRLNLNSSGPVLKTTYKNRLPCY